MVSASRYSRIINSAQGFFFLFGLRGVGKSTWAQEQFPDAYVVDLLDEFRFQTLTANKSEALVRNLPGFLRFLPVAALFHGHVNVAGLARDSATARTTVEGYIAILQDTLLATLLPAFELQLRIRERRHPKLYWNDSGVVRAAKRHRGPVGAEERGPLLEGFVFTVLRAHNEQAHIFDDISYWAPVQARQTEVDYLLRRGREYLAVEVKTNSHFSPTQLSGLRAIADLPRVARRVLVYLGERRLRTDEGIEVWPLASFLEAVARNQLWP